MMVSVDNLYFYPSQVIYSYYHKPFVYNTVYKKENFIPGLGLKEIRDRGDWIIAASKNFGVGLF